MGMTRSYDGRVYHKLERYFFSNFLINQDPTKMCWISNNRNQRKYTIIILWISDALKHEQQDRQANGAAVLSVSESNRRLDEFGKNSAVSR